MTRWMIGLSVVVLVGACSSDEEPAPPVTTSPASGPGGGGTTTSSTGGAGGSGGTAAGTGGTGGGMTECFPFSNDPAVPLALDGTFDATSETWSRPDADVCPATATGPTVPFVAYAFCNDDVVPHTYDFEMISTDGPSGEAPLGDPYLVLYPGEAIPADPLQCSAINDDIPDAIDTSDSLLEGIVVPAGGAITMVGTTFDADSGYYLLVVQNAD